MLENRSYSRISTDEELTEKIRVYGRYLGVALERLFTESSRLGFWDPDDGRFIKKLDYSVEGDAIKWGADRVVEYKYAPFGLFGALYWRLTSSRSDKNLYDQKILRYLDFLSGSVSPSGQVGENSSGLNHALVIICLSLGYLNFSKTCPEKAEEYLNTALKAYDYAVNTWPPGGIVDNHDLFLIWAYSWLYEALKTGGRQTNAVASGLRDIADWVCQIQDRRGIFQTGDEGAGRHQRIMYAATGLGKAAAVLDKKDYLVAVEKSLDFVLQHRLSYDGGFIWYPPSLMYRLRRLFPGYRGVNPFYECHQTFFVNAAEQYMQADGSKDYFPQQVAALDWIFETNRRGVNLAVECSLEIPWRMMDEAGEVYVSANYFKGCYEVGSYIMALTDIIKRAELRKGKVDS